MKISARGRYSMQALFDLAHNSHGQPVPLHLIAQRQDLSLPFLEQIFNKLKRAGIVASVRGPKGGYIITRPCNQVTVGRCAAPHGRQLLRGGQGKILRAPSRHSRPTPR